MFIALYQFSVKPDTNKPFAAWLELTCIYLQRGSLGSRLHRDMGGQFIGYAQWPPRRMGKRR